MPNKRTREHWPSKRFNIGFVYNRNGTAYINIADKVIKSLRMKFIPANKKDALEILDNAVADYLNPKEQIDKNREHTLYTLFQEFGKVHFANYTKDNIRKFRQAFGWCIKQDFPIFQLNDIREHILENVNKSNLSNNTKYKYLQYVRQLLQYAVDEGYIGRNPISKSMMPKKTQSGFPIFTQKEIQQIIIYLSKQIDKREFALLIEFLAITGLRISEALKLTWQDVKKDTLIVHGKGGRERFIPFKPFPELKKVLTKLENLGNDKIFSWTSYSRIEAWLRDACKDLGIYEHGKSFHSIRKMRENQLIQDMRLDFDVTAQLMGHTRQVQEAHYLELLGPEKMTDIIMNR